VLEGVAQQVEHDPLEHDRVDVDAARLVRHLHSQMQAGGLVDRREHRRGVTGRPAHVQPARVRPGPPGVEAGHLEQVIDVPAQPPHVPQGQVHELVPAGVVEVRGVVPQLLQGRAEQGERRAQFVADVGEEGRLGLVQLRERGRPAALRVELRPSRAGSGYLAAEHLHEAQQRGVQVHVVGDLKDQLRGRQVTGRRKPQNHDPVAGSSRGRLHRLLPVAIGQPLAGVRDRATDEVGQPQHGVEGVPDDDVD
jgi:hypothetical protein